MFVEAGEGGVIDVAEDLDTGALGRALAVPAGTAGDDQGWGSLDRGMGGDQAGEFLRASSVPTAST